MKKLLRKWFRLAFPSLLVAAVLCFSDTGHAATNRWSKTGGPEGGRIGTVIARPGTETTYAGTWYHGALYKSTDGGASWTQQELPDSTIKGITTLAYDPNDATIVYAGVQSLGSYGNGIRVLKDNQGSWTSLFPQTTAYNPIVSLATDPVPNPANGKTIVYAGAYSGGVYKSTDGGATWSQFYLGWDPNSGENLSGNSLAVDPTPGVADANRIVFAGTEIGIQRSNDGGRTWLAVPNVAAQTVAIDATFVYAGGTGTIYKNNYKTAGSPWVEISLNDAAAIVTSILIDRKNPALLRVSTTKGVYNVVTGVTDTVSPPDATVSRIIEASVDSAQNSVVFAAKVGNAAGEMVKSTNDGAWVSAIHGIVNTYVYGFAFDPEKPATVYAGLLYGGVYKSDDKGATFQAINEGFPQGNSSSYSINTLLAIPPSGTLLAGTYDGVYRRTNDSTDPNNPQWTWKHQSSPAGGFVHALALDPSDTSNSTIFSATEHGAYLSIDGGVTWSLASAENLAFNDLKFAPDGTLFGAGYLYDEMYDSIEAGVYKRIFVNGSWTWERVTTAVNNDLQPSKLVISGTPTSYNIYTSASYPYPIAGTYIGTNKGTSWAKMAVNIGTPAIDPTSATIYAADGVRRSTDGGNTWTAYNPGLDTTFVVTPLFIDPTGTTLYAGTYGDGLMSITLGTQASSSTSAVAFGDVFVGLPAQQTVTITNNGAENLVFSAITITGTDSGDFSKSGSCLAKPYLAKGEACQLTVTFAPASEGLKNAIIEVFYNGATTQQLPAITLTGNGLLTRLSLANTGNGSIAFGGNTCPLYCNERYVYGSSVLLTAVPAADSEFAGWSGCTSTTSTCTIVLDGNKTVTALFRLKTFVLTGKAANFGGTVSQPDAPVPYGSSYTFVISPNQGYKISSITDNTVPVTATSNTYKLDSITADHEIVVSFIQTTLTGINALATDTAVRGANGNEVIYAGTKHGLFRSSTGGDSWEAVTTNGLPNVNVGAIAVDTGTTPSTLYVATQAGIFGIRTDGTSWTVVSTENSVKSLTIDKGVTPHTLYAGTNGGIFVIKR